MTIKVTYSKKIPQKSRTIDDFILYVKNCKEIKNKKGVIEWAQRSYRYTHEPYIIISGDLNGYMSSGCFFNTIEEIELFKNRYNTEKYLVFKNFIRNKNLE